MHTAVRLAAYCIPWILLISIPAFFLGCERHGRNFSDYPGFDEHFAAHPPSSDIPGPRDRELLRQFRPRFMLAEGQSGPVDFYADYIASGVLSDGRGNVISTQVTRELLNHHKHDPEVTFTHVHGGASGRAAVYGRVDRQYISFDTARRTGGTFTFLTYHIVFRNSGIPTGIPAWQEAVLDLFFNLNDWHQLDHYTAVTLLLEGNGHDGSKPAALMLQQHDNLRTYLLGEEIKFPDDGRITIDIAERSNELYPHTEGRTRHRAVYMPDPEGMRFLLTGEKKPLLAGHDITDGAIEVDYVLQYLPHDDAFYTFKGFLGQRRRLKGRDAPPGAAYNTLPELKPLELQLFSGYWRENHPGDLERLEGTILSRGDYVGFARLQGIEFYRNWQRLEDRPR